MPLNDADYYRQRAEAELELARRASHPDAVAAHRELASAYLGRASAKDERTPAEL